MASRIVAVVTSIGVLDVTCRRCGVPILLAMRASQPGKPAKWLPFDRPRPWPLSSVRNDETGIVIEHWSTEKLHFVTCAAPKPKPKRPSYGARA